MQTGEMRVLPGDPLRPARQRWKELGATEVSRTDTCSQRVKWSLLILLPPHAVLWPNLYMSGILEINGLSKETVSGASTYRWFNSHLFHK